METTHNIRCPGCKRYFEILVTFDRQVFVVGTPSKTEASGFIQGAKSHHPHRNSADPYQQGKDILRNNAKQHEQDQEMYPPNAGNRRFDDTEEDE